MTRVRARLRAVVRRGRAGDDSGQVMLLVIAYSVIALALTLVVASASAVHLERKRLLGVADGAALDAADQVDEGRYFEAGVTPGAVPLSDASVRASVEEYLVARNAHADFRALTVLSQTGSSDGRTAEVVLTSTVEPPLISWAIEAFAGGITLRATSRARVDVS